MYYLELYAMEIAVVSAVITVLALIVFVLASSTTRTGKMSEKISNVAGVVFPVLVVVMLAFADVRAVFSMRYNIVVSSQSANVVSVSRLTQDGAHVGYLLHNNVYKVADYNGPITVSTTAKVPTVDVQVRKNMYGGQKTVLSHLVVPESDIKK
ncbi:hypothetical protein CEB3_c19170 [Peptococcaceae bacterium CEB3]|nr:hypothetical protein CEB3_c19170 [Peptococcaceae bacterium CEB3]